MWGVRDARADLRLEIQLPSQQCMQNDTARASLGSDPLAP